MEKDEVSVFSVSSVFFRLHCFNYVIFCIVCVFTCSYLHRVCVQTHFASSLYHVLHRVCTLFCIEFAQAICKHGVGRKFCIAKAPAA